MTNDPQPASSNEDTSATPTPGNSATPPPAGSDSPDSPAADADTLQPGVEASGPGPSYGGNFGNSTQAIFDDEDRRENQRSGPGRGEFGAQGPGTTQGGYGNQYRADETYAGQLGLTRPSSGGYEGGAPENNTGPAATRNPQGSTFGHQPATPLSGTTVDSTYRNDNAAPTSPSGGYSEDYGHTSLGGSPGTASDPAQAAAPPRNQTEGYLPSEAGSSQQHPGLTYQPDPTRHGSGTGLSGLNEAGQPNSGPAATPPEEAGSRTGYTAAAGEQSYSGNEKEGIGSKGGSYNDPNVNMNPAAGATSPTRDDYRRDEQNENPPQPDSDDAVDYGSAPRRNAGRDAEPPKE